MFEYQTKKYVDVKIVKFVFRKSFAVLHISNMYICSHKKILLLNTLS